MIQPKKHVIIVSSTQYPGYGGAATNAYAIIKYLRKVGYNVAGIFFHNKLDVSAKMSVLYGKFFVILVLYTIYITGKKLIIPIIVAANPEIFFGCLSINSISFILS